jgi:steroid delta-isomerase-like uncharacterized protein
MSVEENKSIVASFYEEAINDRNLGAVDRLLAEDFVHNGEPRGRTGQRQAVKVFLDAFSDLHNEIEFMLAEDDLVAAHQRWSGTHSGEFAGIEATGKKVEFTSTAVLRFEHGLIAEAWDEVDMLSVMQQLGAVPSD